MSSKSVIEHEVVANHDVLRFGLHAVRGDIVGSHPLQSLRESTSKFWEEKKRSGLDLTYGSAFNLRRDLDAQILSRFQRPPGALPSSMLGFEALTGGLDDFAFEDYLNLPQDSESYRPADMHHGIEARGVARFPPSRHCVILNQRPNPEDEEEEEEEEEELFGGLQESGILELAFIAVGTQEGGDRHGTSKEDIKDGNGINLLIPGFVGLLHSGLDTAVSFLAEYGEASRYHVQEVIGKGSYGVVGAAIDSHNGERVAIKKINDVFEHVSDATRILREIKLLRLLRHPDIVEIKHIMLPPSRREFKDIYVVFELMESDLHQVIKANDDLTPEHHQFFLYQLLRALKYIHAANVFHRDLKPKNILANADCKLKICDFGLARVAFNDAPSAIFWTDYVATRWYRAPELCGSFFSKVRFFAYTPAIDIWSIGCIFAEMLTGRPLFPGKNVVHQLDLMTDLLGTPSAESIARIRNEKARRYLSNMRKKPPIPFYQKFPGVDPLALRLLERLLAFDPKDRPTAEELLSISGVDRFKRQFAHLEEHYGKGDRGSPLQRQHASLPRERIGANKDGNPDQNNVYEGRSVESVARSAVEEVDRGSVTDGLNKTRISARSLLKSESISASKCVVVKPKKDKDVSALTTSFVIDFDLLYKIAFLTA
ncbi:mitogen-activated protein kinase 9-like [Canna indica]|uniref:mitogen-activated protein kinase n=1 Tax=Canna indica TaxID=4628 RepID=A0AAQ3Q832_9LILI|nr:mitogen-activated protein kinase 9-like [Canna indica]